MSEKCSKMSPLLGAHTRVCTLEGQDAVASTSARSWDVLQRLPKFKESAPNMYKACCPAHDDRHPSLSIRISDDGHVLLNCHAGCTAKAIVEAVDLTLADLFQPRSREGRQGAYPQKSRATVQPPYKPDEVPPRDGCTLMQYANFKLLPLAFLRDHGLADVRNYRGAPALCIPYFDSDGQTLLTTQYRLALHKPDNGADTRFKFKSGSKPCTYWQWRLPVACARGYITLVEGASDCHSLWYHGEPALGIPGASSWNDERDAPLLDDIAVIYVVIETDIGGTAVLKWLASSRIRERVRLVRLGEHKDPSGLHLACKADPEQFAAAWEAARASATPCTELEQEEKAHHAAKVWTQCSVIAHQTDILDEAVKTLTASGVVGGANVIKLLYLAVTSRLLPRPISMVVKGPSSAGKSFLTERVLEFFPPSAFYALSAMSERALAYSEEPLQHRMLVIYEAAGLRGDFATYLLRSLLSEGRVRYETVMKTIDGLKPCLIEPSDPTGLLVTTTAIQLHPENETRMLSLIVTDTPDQTRAYCGRKRGRRM